MNLISFFTKNLPIAKVSIIGQNEYLSSFIGIIALLKLCLALDVDKPSRVFTTIQSTASMSHWMAMTMVKLPQTVKEVLLLMVGVRLMSL